jgi:hypothetical protein
VRFTAHPWGALHRSSQAVPTAETSARRFEQAKKDLADRDADPGAAALRSPFGLSR